MKVIVDVIQFTLPLTTFLHVSTVNVKLFNFSFDCLIRKCLKIFFTTNWASLCDGSSFFDTVQTRLTEDVSTTHNVLANSNKHKCAVNEPGHQKAHFIIDNECRRKQGNMDKTNVKM